MSQVTHPTSVSSPFTVRRTAVLVGLLGLVAVAFVVVALTLGGSDANTAGSIVSERSGGAAAAGIRFDGGPEEGTRGPAAAQSSPGTRFDGGPEEGTRGPAAAQSSPGSH